MLINREQLLKELDSVSAGLSTREIIEQSSCFAFTKKRVMTFNDDVACVHSTSLKIKGAVPSAPLLNILRKLTDDELNIICVQGEEGSSLEISTKRKKVTIRIEDEIMLPINTVETAEEWKKLPSDFEEAIRIIKECAGTDETKFNLTCINITPKWIEACDGYRLARWSMPIKIAEPIQVRADAIRHVLALGMIEFGETDSWLHFRNDDGLVMSCRKYKTDYVNLSKHLKVTGSPITLPKNLVEGIEAADVFSSESVEGSNQITVLLKQNKIKIVGEGVNGKYEQVGKVKYNGPKIKFLISPTILIDILQKHTTAELSDSKLKVQVGKYRYVTAISSQE